jgi:hypothetical protein
VTVFVPLLKIGFVRVLFVNVSLPASVARVPVVGAVTFVAPVVVNVNEFAPDVTSVDPFASVKVPVVVVTVNPLIVFPVKACVAARRANVSLATFGTV